jgi:hypothetical protein
MKLQNCGMTKCPIFLLDFENSFFFSWCFNVGAFTNYTKKKNSVSFKGPNYNEVYDESQIHFGFKLHQMPFPKCYVQSQGVQELFVKCVNSHYFDLVMRNWVSNSLEFCYCKMEITTYTIR